MILKRKFLPCMERYHKRIALWKWREKAQLLKASITHQPPDFLADPNIDPYDPLAAFKQYQS